MSAENNTPSTATSSSSHGSEEGTLQQRVERVYGRRVARYTVRLLSVVVGLCIWQLLATRSGSSAVFFEGLPSPTEVVARGTQLSVDVTFYLHILSSLQRIAIGFAIAALVGVPLGLVMGQWRLGEDLLSPGVELIRPIPAVAWIPLAILILPTQESSMIFLIFIGAVFPIILNTASGVEQIPSVYLRAASSLGARRSALFKEVILPGAMPSVFSGLTISMGVSWLCLIAAEMIAGEYGIGYFTWEAYSIISYPDVVVGMITIGLLGLASSALLRALGNIAMRWQPRETKGG